MPPRSSSGRSKCVSQVFGLNEAAREPQNLSALKLDYFTRAFRFCRPVPRSLTLPEAKIAAKIA